eukprot:c20407_g1_i1 orf=635-883(-)
MIEMVGSLRSCTTACLFYLKKWNPIRAVLIRQWEYEIEKVIDVLQPGPLGILVHKFSNAEIVKAQAAVIKALDRWQEQAKGI